MATQADAMEASARPGEGGDANSVEDAGRAREGGTDPGDAASSCQTTVIDAAVSPTASRSIDVAYDGDGTPHVVYVQGTSNGAVVHAVRSGGTWALEKMPGAEYVALSIVPGYPVQGVPRIAAAQYRGGSTTVYVPNAGAWQPYFNLSGDSGALVQALRSAVDASGYHVMALLDIGGSLALKHLKPSQTDWDAPLVVSTSPFGAADVTLAADGSVEVVWTDTQGGIWEYNDHAPGTGIHELSSTAAAAAGLGVVSKGQSDGPSVLFAQTSAWSLLHGGTTATVLPGNTAYGAPALVQRADGTLFGAVYQPMGSVFAKASLVTSSGGPWSALGDVPNATAGALTIRADGGASMAVHRQYASPMDSDVALVECP